MEELKKIWNDKELRFPISVFILSMVVLIIGIVVTNG